MFNVMNMYVYIILNAAQIFRELMIKLIVRNLVTKKEWLVR